MANSRINWRAVQSRLGIASDGIPGPITYTAIYRHMGAKAHAEALGRATSSRIGAISENPERLANWFGQMAHESLGFTKLTESLTYSSAARIRAVWPSRFPSVASAERFVRQPQALANFVYGKRMGNIEPNDGWTFRGRGIIHLTGRSNYRTYSGLMAHDFENNPDDAATPEWAVAIAIFYWNRKNLNPLADRDNRREITRLINGGFNGLDDRNTRTARALNLFRATA